MKTLILFLLSVSLAFGQKVEVIQSNGTKVATATTGTGSPVLATSPTLVTPTLGAASATSLTLGSAQTVPNGGTGVASLTAYAPLFGGTGSTAAIQSGTVGTAGQVLTSNGAGALNSLWCLSPSGCLCNGIWKNTIRF